MEERQLVWRVLDIHLEQPGPADPINHEAHRKRGEDRRDNGVGDEDAADQSGDSREGCADEKRPANGHALVGRKRQHPGHRDDHDRDHRQIDPAPDHHEPHAEPKNSENRDAAHERDEIARRQEIVQRQREDDEEPGRKGEDDAFLRDPEPAKIE